MRGRAAIAVACFLVVGATSCATRSSRPRDGDRMNGMRIAFERSGGLAGLRRAANVDIAALPPDEARELRALTDAARVFELPADMPAPRPGADRFRYRLTIEDGDRRHTVDVDEAAAPENLRPLLDWLNRRAAPVAGSGPKGP